MRANSQIVEGSRTFADDLPAKPLVLAAMLFSLCSLCTCLQAQSEPSQTNTQQTTEQRVEHLTDAMAQAQGQIVAYQNELTGLRHELAALKLQMAAEKAISSSVAAPPDGSTATTVSEPHATLDEIRERQAIEESQIATHDVTKVETE